MNPSTPQIHRFCGQKYEDDEYKVLHPINLTSNADFFVILDKSAEYWWKEKDASAPMSVKFPLHKEILIRNAGFFDNSDFEISEKEKGKKTWECKLDWNFDWKNHERLLLNYFRSMYISKLKLSNETVVKYYQIATNFQDVR